MGSKKSERRAEKQKKDEYDKKSKKGPIMYIYQDSDLRHFSKAKKLKCSKTIARSKNINNLKFRKLIP